MERSGVFIVQEGPIDTSNASYARIKVHAVLVKDDDAPVGLIPKFLERNGITLGEGEQYKTVLGLYPPENLWDSVEELFTVLNANPDRKAAAEWLFAFTFMAAFETGAAKGASATWDSALEAQREALKCF